MGFIFTCILKFFIFILSFFSYLLIIIIIIIGLYILFSILFLWLWILPLKPACFYRFPNIQKNESNRGKSISLTQEAPAQILQQQQQEDNKHQDLQFGVRLKARHVFFSNPEVFSKMSKNGQSDNYDHEMFKSETRLNKTVENIAMHKMD